MDASCATLVGVVQKGLRCSYAGAYSWCEGVEGREAAEILAGGRGPALPAKARAGGDDVLGDPVSEILLLRVAAHILEGENCN